MATNLYEAFEKVGFGREARTLSTTERGSVVPALGHYVSIYDQSRAETEESETKDLSNRSRLDAVNNITKFLSNEGNLTKIKAKMPEYTPKSTSSSHEYIQEFINQAGKIKP